MQVIGKGAVRFFGDEAEQPHDADHQTLWQESFAHYFWDTEREVYAFLRVSQIPNRSIATAFLNIWTPDGFYKHTDDLLPLAKTDRSDFALEVGEGLCRYELIGDQFRWTIDDRKFGITANLLFVGFHKGLNFFGEDSGLVRETVPNHTQATGRSTGTVSIAGRTYAIDGLAWRDHSWGYRRWLNIRAHRFTPAILGPQRMFSNVSMIAQDGKLTKFGVLVEHDTARFLDDFDIVAFVGEDGTSTLGAHVDLRLDGRTIPIEYEPLGPSSAIMTDGLCYVELPCRVRFGDDVGVGWLETTHHAQGGEDKPFVHAPGVIDNGFHPARR